MINASFHKLENISFFDEDWTSLPRIAKETIQLIITSQTAIYQWLEQKQLPEKMKLCFKNNENCRVKIDDIYNQLRQEVLIQATDTKYETQQLENQIKDLKKIITILSESLTVRDIQNPENKKNFENNMKIFDKIYPEPNESTYRKECLQYINSRNIWQITNEFTQDCHLQDQLNSLQAQVKDLHAMINEKDHNLQDQLINNRLKIEQNEKKAEQQSQKIQDIHDIDLKQIRMSQEQLFKDFQKMSKSQEQLNVFLNKLNTQASKNERQIVEQMHKQIADSYERSNISREILKASLDGNINTLNKEFQEKVSKLIQEDEILQETCDQLKIQIEEISYTQQTFFQGQMGVQGVISPRNTADLDNFQTFQEIFNPQPEKQKKKVNWLKNAKKREQEKKDDKLTLQGLKIDKEELISGLHENENEDLDTDPKVKTGLLVDLRQSFQQDFSEFQNKNAENASQIQELQVKCAEHHQDIHEIITFKKKNFINNIQAKMESINKKQIVKLDEHEIQIRSILDILDNFVDGQKYSSPSKMTLPKTAPSKEKNPPPKEKNSPSKEKNQQFLQRNNEKLKRNIQRINNSAGKSDLKAESHTNTVETEFESPPQDKIHLELAPVVPDLVNPKLDYRFLRKSPLTPRLRLPHNRSLQTAKLEKGSFIKYQKENSSHQMSLKTENFNHHMSLKTKPRIFNDKKPGSLYYLDTKKSHLRAKSISTGLDLSADFKVFNKSAYHGYKADSLEVDQNQVKKTQKDENYQKQLSEIKSLIKERDRGEVMYHHKYFSMPQ